MSNLNKGYSTDLEEGVKFEGYVSEYVQEEYESFCEIYGINPEDKNSSVLFESLCYEIL